MVTRRKQRRELERKMALSLDYESWKTAAEAFDVLEGGEAFKRDETSKHYDHNLIRERLAQLRLHRAADDGQGLVFFLRQGLLRDLGNLANPVLYEQTRTGTKYLIDDYVSEVVAAVNLVTDADYAWFPLPEKLIFLEETLQSFGRSALLLSGGANFGVFHVGVLRALWREGLLPRIFSGASTGAIIAGMLGTHADDELDRIFDLDHSLRLDAWKPRGLSALRGQSLYDAAHLEEVVRANVGPMTFREAYAKTGRIINISVSATPTDHTARLLNYLTTPHIFVWSAVMASCALPVIFPPVVMKMKLPSGEVEDYMHGTRWIDGSMRGDLPMKRLGELYNVNHHVVSQANPHIAPFVGEHEMAMGPARLVKDLAFGELHHRSRQLLSVLQTASPLETAESALVAFDAIVGQTYRGDITITPPTKLGRYLRLARNLTPSQAAELARAGELATWSVMSKVRNQTKIGQTLERCVRRTKAKLRQQRAPPLAALNG